MRRAFARVNPIPVLSSYRAPVIVASSENAEVSDRRPSSDAVPNQAADSLLSRAINWTIPTIVADLLCVLGPLGFVVFAIVILKTHDKKTFPSDKYNETTTVLATLFPIVFAAILGRLMSQVSRWKLEDGARLRSLEQLMGSRSVGGTVLTAFQLPINLLTVLLMAVWSFSPLGAQALLRQHYTRLQQVNTSMSLVYFDTSSPPTQYAATVPGADVFEIALRTPDAAKLAPLDTWGNVKVPLFSSYANKSIGGWQAVSPTAQYSSLLGVPIRGIPLGNSSFEIQSSYLELECDQLELDFGPFGYFGTYVALNEPSSGSVSANGTWQGYNYNGTANVTNPWATFNLAADTFNQKQANRSTTFSLNSELYNSTDIETNQARLLFQATLLSRIRFDLSFKMRLEYFRAYFKATQKYVESRVKCTGGASGCAVVEQRPSRRPHPPETLTQLSDLKTFLYISENLPQRSDRAQTNSQDPTVSYVGGLSLPEMLEGNVNKSREGLAGSSRADLAFRLGRVLNTHLMSGQMIIFDFVGNFSDPRHNLTTPDGAQTSVLEELYVVSALWSCLYIASCAVLLLGGMASVILCHMCHGPELLGFASSVIRDSRFVNVDPKARQLDGMALAARAGDRRFRYGYMPLHDDDLGGGGGQEPVLGVGLQDNVKSIRRRTGSGERGPA